MYIFRNIVNLEKFLSFFFIDIHRAIFHRSGSVSLHLSFLYRILHTSSSRPHNIYKSHSVVSDSLQPQNPWNSPHQNTGVGSCSHLQRIFQTQGLNPGLLHWQWIFLFFPTKPPGKPPGPTGQVHITVWSYTFVLQYDVSQHLGKKDCSIRMLSNSLPVQGNGASNLHIYIPLSMTNSVLL